jgi:hypothetical protein
MAAVHAYRSVAPIMVKRSEESSETRHGGTGLQEQNPLGIKVQDTLRQVSPGGGNGLTGGTPHIGLAAAAVQKPTVAYYT